MEQNFTYLLILIVVAVGVMILLRFAQSAVLRELSTVLYSEDDPDRFLSMLKSRRLRLVLRNSTLALLTFDGYCYAGNAKGVIEAAEKLDRMKLRPSEKLNYMQKAFGYFIASGDGERANGYLNQLDSLLKAEEDPGLKEILVDAKLLYGVYVNRDTSLIDRLTEIEKRQEGNRKGLTQYRLAKLYHFKGDVEEAGCYLRLAQENLQDTAWLAVVDAAKNNHSLLDVH